MQESQSDQDYKGVDEEELKEDQNEEDELKILDQDSEDAEDLQQNQYAQSNEGEYSNQEQVDYEDRIIENLNHRKAYKRSLEGRLSSQEAQERQGVSQSTKLIHPLQKKHLQILQKLQSQSIDSPQQYQTIIKKLHQQNLKLQSDLQLLRQKVDLLKLKQLRKHRQNIKLQNNLSALPGEEYQKLKKQLKSKYKELQKLQKRSNKSQTKFALEIQYREFVNKLIQLENQRQSSRSRLMDEKRVNKKLNKELKQYQGIKLSTSKQALQLQSFNKQLKSKIFLIKKIIANQQQSELEVHKYQIQAKQQQKKDKQIQRIKTMQKKSLFLGNISVKKSKIKVLNEGEDNVVKLETLGGSLMKFHTIDSKVRAKTEFSFQQSKQCLQKSIKDAFSPRRNARAVTQLQSPTPKSINRSIIAKLPSVRKPIPSQFKFTSLNSQQIAQQINFLRNENRQFQNLSISQQSRLCLLQQQMYSNNWHQGLSKLFVKEKYLLMTKNKWLISELGKFYEKKIELLKEYNLVQKYYEKKLDQKNQMPLKQNQVDLENSYLRANNNSSIPKIDKKNSQKISEFNRSISQMKFTKNIRLDNQNQEKKIFSSRKSLNNCKRPSGLLNKKERKSPSMPLYENGRSQSPKRFQIHEENKTDKFQHRKLEKAVQEQAQQKIQPKATQKEPPTTPPIETSETHTQTQFNLSSHSQAQLLRLQPKPITKTKSLIQSISRQDFVGQIQLDECDFDDRIYQSFGEKVFINELIVHHNSKGIVFVKAKYKPVSGSSKIVEVQRGIDDRADDDGCLSTEVSYKVSSSLIEKSLMNKDDPAIQSVTQLSINDYIKQVKLFFNQTQGFVSKLQIISKYNVKYEFGNKQLAFPTPLSPYLNLNSDYGGKDATYLQNTRKKSKSRPKEDTNQRDCHKYYLFDINPYEYPSFMFGNCKLVNEHLMLAGLGFVIENQQK